MTSFTIASPTMCEVQNWKIKSYLLMQHADAKVEGFSLSKPAVLGTRCAVGTDMTTTAPQWLMILDSTATGRKNPLLGQLQLKEDVRDVHWIHPELILCTAGEGKIHLINVSTSHEMKVHGTLPSIHTLPLREIAINCGNRAQFVSGGYDKKLCFVDLERPDALQTIRQDDVIGSVRWPLCNQNVCPSLTLDDGTFLIYDTRVRPIGPPAFKATMGKKELFTHERYTDHNVLLGFGDGEVQHIDVRVTDRILHKFQEPAVAAIGGLEFNTATNQLSISGLGNASIWKHDGSTRDAKFWCQLSETSAGSTGFQSAFVGSEAIVTCSSEGIFYVQRLE